jgi:hypothetical protein
MADETACDLTHTFPAPSEHELSGEPHSSEGSVNDAASYEGTQRRAPRRVCRLYASIKCGLLVDEDGEERSATGKRTSRGKWTPDEVCACVRAPIE